MTDADELQAELDKRVNLRTLAGHEALSADLTEFEAQLNKERELLRLALSLLKRAREEAMPYYLRREIDDCLTAAKEHA